jgi:indolepyruvate ferredoxin oxidoreductase, alpha subunit
MGSGDEFAGTGILAVTKALLQSGVACVAGDQGSPIAHRIGVAAYAQHIRAEMVPSLRGALGRATRTVYAAAKASRPTWRLRCASSSPTRPASLPAWCSMSAAAPAPAA